METWSKSKHGETELGWLEAKGKKKGLIRGIQPPLFFLTLSLLITIQTNRSYCSMRQIVRYLIITGEIDTKSIVCKTICDPCNQVRPSKAKGTTFGPLIILQTLMSRFEC